MTLQQLNYAITIAETGSMNRAAEKLYIAQPSLSASMQELEKELGITIFNRGGRGVTLTPEGQEFILYANQVYGQYRNLLEKFGKGGNVRKKFGVSAQHYSFAVRAFVEMAKHFDILEYDFAIRETRTRDVITDVATLRSEIGILYLSDFNRRAILKMLANANLEFRHLIDCDVYAYLWRGHPLANEKSVTREQLSEYPCMTFEQGENSSFYLTEEVFNTAEYARTVKVNDRATMLNLMVGLNGYTICSGIICEELNGTDYAAVRFVPDGDPHESIMEVGYIVRKDSMLSRIGELYVSEIKKYLGIASENLKEQ